MKKLIENLTALPPPSSFSKNNTDPVEIQVKGDMINQKYSVNRNAFEANGSTYFNDPAKNVNSIQYPSDDKMLLGVNVIKSYFEEGDVSLRHLSMITLDALYATYDFSVAFDLPRLKNSLLLAIAIRALWSDWQNPGKGEVFLRLKIKELQRKLEKSSCLTVRDRDK